MVHTIHVIITAGLGEVTKVGTNFGNLWIDFACSNTGRISLTESRKKRMFYWIPILAELLVWICTVYIFFFFMIENSSRWSWIIATEPDKSYVWPLYIVWQIVGSWIIGYFVFILTLLLCFSYYNKSVLMNSVQHWYMSPSGDLSQIGLFVFKHFP